LEREESLGQKHDQVQCVPRWVLALTFAQVKKLPPEVCKTVGSRTTSTVLRIFKEVLVYLFEHEGLFDNHAAVVLDHERGKLGAIDEH